MSWQLDQAYFHEQSELDSQRKLSERTDLPPQKKHEQTTQKSKNHGTKGVLGRLRNFDFFLLSHHHRIIVRTVMSYQCKFEFEKWDKEQYILNSIGLDLSYFECN